MRIWKDKELSLNDDNTLIIVKESITLECGKCIRTKEMHFDKKMVQEALDSYAGFMFKDMFGDLITKLQ